MSDSKTRLGRVEEITSTANPRIKSIKALALKKNRENEKLFLAEGMKLVTDALAAGWKIRTLIHSKKLLDDHDGLKSRVEQLAATVRARGGDIFITNDKILTSITRRDNAQMVVAVIEQKFTDAKQIKAVDNDTWVALDRVRDPGNLGTIIRTADALGAKGVLLVGETTDPFALEAVRATMGSLFHMPIARLTEKEFLVFSEGWKQSGNRIVGTHLNGAVDHRELDYSKNAQIVLMGNEQKGLTDELSDTCTDLAFIAMDGVADSLNLAVATGIMLFEVRRHALKPNDKGSH